ncbi:L,D-transpeptidase family protein [Puniceibacterium sediminis]|uniref:L,D-transpeptidase catalytic domain n=1 Tax=Puniceibacterium sediminis TaxID=1608407 RepID=A0A238VT88_9RHOB|nr:L,D-transpeptidase family protein [Puniceibacterium sediminis]SNR36719.1 L,D-transpeptidase catalytic domain [Puniceibacterium sediminis]
MRFSRFLILALLALTLAGCADSKFKSYNGPAVTHVVVQKGARKMYLLHNDKVLRDFDIGLGFAPTGHKMVEGDGRTPEGTYLIDRRNPNSRFHLSIGVSYPNHLDRALAEEIGKSPGGDIFIHGRPKQYRNGQRDWTWGCISVTDEEIEEVYAMVRDGTPISINP